MRIPGIKPSSESETWKNTTGNSSYLVELKKKNTETWCGKYIETFNVKY